MAVSPSIGTGCAPVAVSVRCSRGMDFDEAVGELGRLQGTSVLLQVRAAGAKRTLFEMIDGINEVWADKDDADRVYVNFHDAEGSVALLRTEFVDAGWASAWTRGEEHEGLLRLHVGGIEVGFQPI